jgi:hypothetical protein
MSVGQMFFNQMQFVKWSLLMPYTWPKMSVGQLFFGQMTWIKRSVCDAQTFCWPNVTRPNGVGQRYLLTICVVDQTVNG